MPPSSVARAKKLFTDFTGHNADEVLDINIKMPNAGLHVGKCEGILYSTVRDGVEEKYIHEFKKSAQPDFVVSDDGEMLLLLGGNFRFTERGIVDN